MAPSATSTLHPIVIGPIQVPPYFTTLGTGLLYESHPRESASSLKLWLLSKPSLLTNKSKPKAWWRGQCLLYGLDAPPSHTTQALRASLEAALAKRGGLVVTDALVELEHKENGKFRKLNAQVREATGVEGNTGEEVKVKGKAPKETKTQPKPKGPKAVAAKQLVGGSTGKGKKTVAQKDPLKIVKGATKITKIQPTKKSAATAKASTPANNTARNSTASKARAAPKPRMKRPLVGETDDSGIPQSPSGDSGLSVGRAKQTDHRNNTESNVNDEESDDSWADEMDYTMDYETDSSQYRAQISRINDPDTLSNWRHEQDRLQREREFYGW